jgi:hypothetical protein
MAFFGNGLVIRHPRPEATAQDAGGPPPAPPNATDKINLSNILKLVPGDVVAIYLAGMGYDPKDPVVAGITWPTLFFWLCLLACILLRYFVTKKSPGGVNWMLIVVTTVAFFVWAHAVNQMHGPVIPGFYGSAAGFVAMLIGLFAPVVVPSQPE